MSGQCMASCLVPNLLAHLNQATFSLEYGRECARKVRLHRIFPLSIDVLPPLLRFGCAPNRCSAGFCTVVMPYCHLQAEIHSVNKSHPTCDHEVSLWPLLPCRNVRSKVHPLSLLTSTPPPWGWPIKSLPGGLLPWFPWLFASSFLDSQPFDTGLRLRTTPNNPVIHTSQLS